MNPLDAVPGEGRPGIEPRKPEMVARLVSALVLAALALTAVLASRWSFALLVVVAGGIVSWEWARLVRASGFDSIALLQTLTVAAVAVLGTLRHPDLVALAIALGGAGIGLSSIAGGSIGWALAGLAYAAFPAWALVWLRSDQSLGGAAMLYLLAVAWTTDSASFAAGRLLGGPKLAPRISPKKTWSGLIVGALVPSLIGFAAAKILEAPSALWLALVSVVLAAFCQLGDLGESALKRRFGVKDASRLIPGHGGLLDRIDGLLIAAMAAALIALRDSSSPGRGLLIW